MEKLNKSGVLKYYMLCRMAFVPMSFETPITAMEFDAEHPAILLDFVLKR
jgi:hypothetical protein